MRRMEGLHTLGRSRDSGRKRVPRLGPPTRTTALVVGEAPLFARLGTCSDAMLLATVGGRYALADLYVGSVVLTV